METDMEENKPHILCTKVDSHAGNWPSSSFLELFQVAKECVEGKYHKRPEIAEVYTYVCRGIDIATRSLPISVFTML